MMDKLQTFQTVAHERGFVNLNECEDGTVLWLRRETPGAVTHTHQRICMDSLTSSATVYWTNNLGEVNSKTFRAASMLRDWLAMDQVQ